MADVMKGEPVVPGKAVGTLIAANEPLSFWGGYDQQTGEIIDRRHPLSGRIGGGKIVAVPFTRGSSTTTGILIESVRSGVAPVAILTSEVDSFLALASIVADELYGKSFPVVALQKSDFKRLESGMELRIEEDGHIHILGRMEDDG